MTAQSAKDRRSGRDRTPAAGRISRTALKASIARRTRGRLGIRLKATALAAVFGGLPVFLVGAIAYWVADRSIVQKIAEEKITESAQLSDRLSRFLEDRIANLKTVVRVAELTGGTAFSGAPRERARTAAQQKLEKELSNFTQDYPVYSNISLYDLQGNPIARSAGSAREPNQKNFPYFQQVIEKGIPVISEPIATKVGNSQRWAIYLGAPIKNDGDRVSAAIVAKIPVEFVGNAILRTSGLSEHTTYCLIDSSGRIFQTLNPQNQQANSAIGSKIAEKTALFAPVNAQRRNQAWIDGSSWGEQLYAYSPVLNVSGLSWSVVTATDSAIAFAPQRNLLQAIGVGTVLTALVTAVLGAFIANRVTLPVLQATSAVEKIGQGNLDIRVPVRGNDELAVLGDNINRMASQIQNLLKTLRQNADRLSLQNRVLAELARNEGILLGDVKIAATAFTKATAETLGVELASIWLYNSDRTKLVCLDLYELTPQQHSDGMKLKIVDFPNYFQSLERDAFIVANDVNTHPALEEFSDSYLTPVGIQSRLDVPIQITAQTVGIVCCEQVGSPRQWLPEEQTFVGSIANLVSLALENQTTQEEVGHLLDIVSSVEKGDLTARANVSDRATGLVADTFNRLLEQLSQILAQVSGTAQRVTQTSQQLDESSRTVALNAQQQAEGVTKVLNLTKWVQNSARHSAKQIALANQSLGEVRTTVEQGQLAIDTLTQGIRTLQAGAERVVRRTKDLDEFVTLTDGFVQEQSQLAELIQSLAMGATLLAARATAQQDPRQMMVLAKEFDTIANQIKDLAQQTDKNLSSLEKRTDRIKKAVSSIERDLQGIDGLVDSLTLGVEKCAAAFESIQSATENAIQIGATVARSNQQIVQTARSTATAMDKIARLADRTAQLTQTALIQSERMQQSSEQLLGRIQFLRLPAEATERVDLSEEGENALDTTSTTAT